MNGTFNSANGQATFLAVPDSKFATICLRAVLLICASLSADPTRYSKISSDGVLSEDTPRVPFSLNVRFDSKVLQPPLLVPVSATVDGSNELVMPFTVTILDGDGEWAWS